MHVNGQKWDTFIGRYSWVSYLTLVLRSWKDNYKADFELLKSDMSYVDKTRFIYEAVV